MASVENKKPKISVVMPFYNAEKFLDESIQSILNQTFTDFEFIIINDASTDNSNKIVQKYLDDKRIIYIKNKENKGIVCNLNDGLKKARADVIARMDGDDISMPTRFEKQYNFLKNNPDISIVGTFAEVIDSNNIKIEKMTFATGPIIIKKQSLYRGPFLHPTVFFKKDVLNKIGGYNSKFKYCQDIDIFLRILFAGFQGANLSDFLLKYRKHSLSTDSNKREKAFLGYKIKVKTMYEFKYFNIKTLFFVHADLIITFFPYKLKKVLVKYAKTILRINNKV